MVQSTVRADTVQPKCKRPTGCKELNGAGPDYNKPVKRFQMKSNGCRDVQHTGIDLQPSIFSIFCNLELICISYNYDAATDVGMLGKMCRSSAPCLCTLLTSVPSCLCAL